MDIIPVKTDGLDATKAKSDIVVKNNSSIKIGDAAKDSLVMTNSETSMPVINTNSFESDRSKSSMNDSESMIDTQEAKTNTAQDGIRISRVEGVGPTCVVVPVSERAGPNTKKEEVKGDKETSNDDDDDEWETVESKSRSYRNRKANTSNTNVSRKVKNKRTPAARKGNADRKMIREILSSVLDSVDVEIRKKKRVERKNVVDGGLRFSGGKKKSSMAQLDRRSLGQHLNPDRSRVGKSQSQRDLSVGTHVTQHKKIGTNSNAKVPKQKEATLVRHHSLRTPHNKGIPKGGKLAADQGTATTAPETLSGNSANSQLTEGENEPDGIKQDSPPKRAGTALPGDSGSLDVDDTGEVPESKANEQAPNYVSPPPPLQTLLGPGNTNSASSSVASSLEAPHASSHRHHHSSCGNENDVGYHLLDVCSRLSKDMGVFMMRRNQALAARRRERGALLTVLQDTASRLWMGRSCHVEMYGSCATQLDLPSSDLDIVIRGLDSQNQDLGVVHGGTAHTAMARPSGSPNGMEHTNIREFIPSSPIPTQGHNIISHPHSAPTRTGHTVSPINPYARIVPSVNGERVLLLAAEIERQPWAVQVKAIPTASVPVVKLVADPSRLPGAVASVTSGENWIMQQHHMAAQAAVGLPLSAPQGQIYPPHTPPPWRGADVMNGLFSVDITFEGPEHGGLGSTVISAGFVQEACNETGLSPERTPIVQVLMVLKELLAQRRLNEPFSGGLGSYALMLMVVAVVKERRLIREEMERMERHRRAVSSSVDTAGPPQVHENLQTGANIDVSGAKRSESANVVAGNTIQQAPKHALTKSRPPSQQNTTREHTGKKPKQPTREATAHRLTKGRASSQQKREGGSSSSSWASIARRSVSSTSNKGNGQNKSTASTSQEKGSKSCTPVAKPGSFAEVVSGKNGKLKDKPVSRQHTAKRGGHGAPSGKRHDSQARVGQNEQNQNPSNKNVVNSKQNRPEKKQSQSISVEQQPPKIHRQISASKLQPTKSSQDVTNTTRKQDGHTPSQQQSGKSPTQVKPNSLVPLEWSLFPQGSNDIMEVLCSGETTAGKLLMHFLMFYGEHFDSRSHSVDVRGTQHPEFNTNPINSTLRHLSPFIPRKAKGSYHPVTGMLTIDPIVIYDAWEGGEGANVARSCHAWTSIRWHFAQCYMTVSSAIERNESSGATPAANPTNGATTDSENPNTCIDMVSPLLEMLISF
mmetsp:Transcript_40806/g.57367  ORF Transcript_40806/g.57367 Transcript_40806/m.57367 type:complete len:1211 (+) Transcript_40806:109-3741(+)